MTCISRQKYAVLLLLYEVGHFLTVESRVYTLYVEHFDCRLLPVIRKRSIMILPKKAGMSNNAQLKMYSAYADLIADT